jgi:2-C-methyl-D-erythritol 4-phosphate cytidylyltransferase
MGTGAILLCAGQGERLGAGVPKALAALAGRPLFTWSLEAFEASPAIEHIVVVGPARTLQEALWACGMHAGKVAAWCEGGRERQHSVARGLAALPEACDVVLVHDAARALVTPALIARVAADARTHGAAIAAVPVDDTLKRVTLEVIEDTVPRAGLWRAQTPQGFRRDWLAEAHARAGAVATDDAALVEAAGHRVRVTLGEATNLKITTPDDLHLAEAWLSARV